MNVPRGSTPSTSNGVAKDLCDLTHDIVSLAELQFELFRIDCREGVRRLLIPLALLFAAACVAVGAVPIALTLMADVLVQAAGLSWTAALSIVTVSGFLVAAVFAVAGWFCTRGLVRLFARSREEWINNTTSIRRALTRSAPGESMQEDR